MGKGRKDKKDRKEGKQQLIDAYMNNPPTSQSTNIATSYQKRNSDFCSSIEENPMKKQILKTPDKMNTEQECNIESPISDTKKQTPRRNKTTETNYRKKSPWPKNQIKENATSISNVTERLQGHMELEVRITNMGEEMSSLKQMCSLLQNENEELQNRITELKGSI